MKFHRDSIPTVISIRFGVSRLKYPLRSANLRTLDPEKQLSPKVILVKMGQLRLNVSTYGNTFAPNAKLSKKENPRFNTLTSLSPLCVNISFDTSAGTESIAS